MCWKTERTVRAAVVLSCISHPKTVMGWDKGFSVKAAC